MKEIRIKLSGNSSLTDSWNCTLVGLLRPGLNIFFFLAGGYLNRTVAQKMWFGLNH